jgi:hypothetical protein
MALAGGAGLSVREERRRALVGRWAGSGEADGVWMGWRFRFVFFLFIFQIHFKLISNPFKFKSFTCFQIQILTQISPTILKAFHKPFLTTFQTYFKFNLYTNFYKLFHNYFQGLFHKYFKTFKTTPQPKLMHSNHDAQALIASKLLK